MTQIVLPLGAPEATLASVGGKALNLGELIRAGFPVPGGFCVTTAAYTIVGEAAELEPILDALAQVSSADATSLEQFAAAIRSRLMSAPIPESVEAAVTEAYRQLSGQSASGGSPDPAVAVRSSATAEDLPFASFAGQQDTYLNMVGLTALLNAVRSCWASLWTDRAVTYRAANNIDPRTVRLAVVVQGMVDAQVAGVLFTANPLTGKRRQAVIDAAPGLGEAVVSGAVNPDHFVVDTDGASPGPIVERHVADKQVQIRPSEGGGTQRVDLPPGSDTVSLTDEQVLALAHLGVRVEQQFGAPQDIEWAVDSEGILRLLQARPITTLYPLPASAPTSDDTLRVYFSINVAQGVYGPFTPMGRATFRLMVSSGATRAGFPPADPLSGPAFLVEAGQRLFLDTTLLLRSMAGRHLLSGALGQMEARSAVVVGHLASDPRLSAIPTSRRDVVRRLLHVLPRFRIVPLYVAQALVSPRSTRKRLQRTGRNLRKLAVMPPGATSHDRIDAFERLVLQNTADVLLGSFPVVLVIFGLPALLGRLLSGLATRDEMQSVLRSLPYNPTTEMDLALWRLAVRMRSDSNVLGLFRDTPPEQLAARYREGNLPPVLQQGLADFLRVYGHRAVAEIDLGVTRWGEDPTHVLGALANYLRLENPRLAPSVQFRWGGREAHAMVAELTRRARERNPLVGRVVAFALRRIRTLTGLREVPKFNLILMMWSGRQLLLPVGEDLVRRGCLQVAEDIFFLDTAEARQALEGRDFRELVAERRAAYRQESQRRHIPRVLLSDGTEPERAVLAAAPSAPDKTLVGTPASAGVVIGTARTILDPRGAHLLPGEILVAPSTDPGWTPLFLTAGGLVMEMGGAMSHGAVVAREYGIPAVVGVVGATERIATGQQITVDGSAGSVSLE